MARGSSAHFSSDYICSFCGDVCVCFDIGVSRERRYSFKPLYCPVCMVETDHYRLGDKDVVKAHLEALTELQGIDYEIYDLLRANEARKEKRLIKK